MKWSFCVLCPFALCILGATVVSGSAEHFLEYGIPEEQPPNTFVGNLITDEGLDQKYHRHDLSSLRFSLLTQPSLDRRFFAIDELTGVIQTTQRIDRERACPGSVDCVAQFDVVVQPQPFFHIIKVKIEISDENDNAPTFPEKRIHHQISESAEMDTSLAIPAAVDADSGANAIQKYDIFSTSSKFELVVNVRADGGTDLRLLLKERLDRETEDRYQVIVMAVDGGDPPKSGSTLIDITVLDANDNNPEFDNATYEVRLLENVAVGTVIVRMRARDKDLGLNGAIIYEFSRHTSYEYGHLFGIKSDSGKIYLKDKLDYETSSVHLLSVIANDRGPDSLPAHASVIVRVDDVNDNAPQISLRTLTVDGQAEVMENSPVGTFVAYVSVTDRDQGENGRVSCSLNSDYFSQSRSQSSDFQIVTMIPLDREDCDSYQMVISCSDQGLPPQTTAAQLRVRVLDENDNTPTFARQKYEVSIDENRDPGLSVVHVSATDRDTALNGEIVYSLDENVTSMLLVEPGTGIVRTMISFDRELIQFLQFYVTASDLGQPSRISSAFVSLVITDVDDERPTFSKDKYVFEVPENNQVGSEVGQVTAHDRDSALYNAFQFSIDPDSRLSHQFDVEPVTGVITAKEIFDRERKSQYRFNVLAISNSYTTKTHVTVHVTDLNDNKPMFTFPVWNNETVGVSSDTPSGYRISRLKAIDQDAGINSNLTFQIRSGNERNLISLNPVSGALTVNGALASIDFEDLLLQVIVQDAGDPTLSDSGDLRVVISKDIPFIDIEKNYSILAKDGVLAIILAITLSVTILSAGAVIVVIACIIRKRSQARQQQQQQQQKLKPGVSGVYTAGDFYCCTVPINGRTGGGDGGVGGGRGGGKQRNGRIGQSVVPIDRNHVSCVLGTTADGRDGASAAAAAGLSGRDDGRPDGRPTTSSDGTTCNGKIGTTTKTTTTGGEGSAGGRGGTDEGAAGDGAKQHQTAPLSTGPALMDEKETVKYQSDTEYGETQYCPSTSSQNSFPRSSSAYWMDEDSSSVSRLLRRSRQDERLSANPADKTLQVDERERAGGGGGAGGGSGQKGGERNRENGILPTTGKLDKSTCKSLGCFDEDDTKRPVVVFVKDQRELERKSPTVIIASNTAFNRGPAVQRRPSDLYSERFLYHIGSSGGAAAAASTADGIGFSQTLPLNVLRNVHSDAAAAAAVRKEHHHHRSVHHTVWPRKTDKIYTCEHEQPPSFPTRTDSKGFTSNSFGRDFLKRDSSIRAAAAYAPGGGGGGGLPSALVQCIVTRDNDFVGWTTGNWKAPSPGGSTITATAQPLPPPRGSASSAAAPGGCAGRNKDSWARDAGEFDDRVMMRRKQSGDPGGATGGGSLQQGRCNRKTQQQQQQQQLVVNEDGRLVVTSGFDSLSQALPDTKV